MADLIAIRWRSRTGRGSTICRATTRGTSSSRTCASRILTRIKRDLYNPFASQFRRTREDRMSTAVALQPQTATDQCPWCGTTISRARFSEIQTAIAEQERKKLAHERARIQAELSA